jgi:hypothetical protein
MLVPCVEQDPDPSEGGQGERVHQCDDRFGELVPFRPQFSELLLMSILISKTNFSDRLGFSASFYASKFREVSYA